MIDDMNLLFIHANFPGQFLNLAPFLASSTGGRTVFLTQSDNPQNIRLQGVDVVRMQTHREVSSSTHDYLRQPEESVLRGQAVVKALDRLLQQGFQPDIVISHAGMGFGMYVKALLPNVRLISYVEWFFKRETAQYLFADYQINHDLSVQTALWPLIHEMLQADDLVCPTSWQASQFPDPFRQRIQVIFDGVDLDLFQPKSSREVLTLSSCSSGQQLTLSPFDRVMTYATRGMETLRGFPEFMRAAAVAQQNFPDLQVVIAGKDRLAYSYPSSHPSGSWKQQMLLELADQLDLKRLHFLGLLQYGELAQLMQRSDLYCYFTRPYVVSWSVFEAAACGARLLVNQFGGLDEVLAAPPLLPPVDLEDQEAINRAVLKGLAMPSSQIPQASLLPSGMDLAAAQSSWLKLLNHG